MDYREAKNGEFTYDDNMSPAANASKSMRPNVSHYTQGSIEPIDFINSHDLNFNLGNAIKYITRCNYKGSKEEDLKKAIDYINFELGLQTEEEVDDLMSAKRDLFFNRTGMMADDETIEVWYSKYY